MSKKFASVKNFTFPPTPKSLFFLEIMYHIRAAVRTTMMVDLPILQFRNPRHSSLLGKYHLHCFIAFCANRSNISLDMCIK